MGGVRVFNLVRQNLASLEVTKKRVGQTSSSFSKKVRGFDKKRSLSGVLLQIYYYYAIFPV